MGRPRVSVIVPTRDRARFLALAIESVCAQTFDDFELIVVDDGSRDETHALLTRSGDRLRALRTDRPRGVSAARNLGASAARGDLIAFLDDDDLWTPDKLAHQVAWLDGDPSYDGQLAVLAGIDAEGRARGVTHPGHAQVGPIASARRLVESTVGQFSTLILRRAAFDRAGPFDERLRIGEDVDWCLRALQRGVRLYQSDRIVGSYRRHGANVSRWGRTHAEDDVALFERWVKAPLPEAELAIIGRRLALAHYRLAVARLDETGPSAATATLFARAALADPWVDARARNAPHPTARHLLTPWIAALASALGLAQRLRAKRRRTAANNAPSSLARNSDAAPR